MGHTKKSLAILPLALIWVFESAAADPVSGLWYSPARSGHGLDIQRVGDQFTVMFYTFTDDNQPVWYLSVAEMENQILSGSLGLFEYDAERSPPQQRTQEPGEFSINFDEHSVEETCAKSQGHSAIFSWTMPEGSGTWCIQPLLRQDNAYQQDFTGLWYAGAQDQGWGVSLDYEGDGPVRTEAAVLFFYDRNGYPRWAYGQTLSGGSSAEIDLLAYEGYCRTCESVPLDGRPVGTLRHELTVSDNAGSGTVNVDATYPFAPGGQWQRDASPLMALSSPAPGLLPMPDRLAADQAIAILNVFLVPMTEGLPTLPRQSVLVRDGVIIEIEPADDFEAPANAAVVDGRDLYLAPGITEMHLHVSVGGDQASEEAGLLMIANGVTTALNMGNSFRSDVPALSRRYQTELIGPQLYSGQVAYGPGDLSNATLTVRSPAKATEYAERIAELGYDYIKTYWRLSPSVIRQFQEDGLRLGLPIVGHIPLTLPANTLLRDGQAMAAHIQEPFVTIMDSVRDESLFQRAADIFLRHGTYLTPTLAVFESYSSISGNMRDNYERLIAREGNQYVHPAIKSGWENYFNSTPVLTGNHQNLMELTEFYKKMTKFFFDAGVPLLTGTDAPGFPGVMSGFGVHQELKLLVETGIPDADAYAIASRNAGRFVAETLAPDVGFGTLEAGKRGDLLLLEKNPLDSIDHLKRPLAVMSAGRFWSRGFLDAELQALAVRVEAAAKTFVQPEDAEHLFCTHH